MNNLFKQFAEQKRQEKRRRAVATSCTNTETFKILNEIYGRLQVLTEKDPFTQLMHHLASPAVMDLWGPHMAEAGESLEALQATPGGVYLYHNFITSLWKETSDRVMADLPLIDPLGDLYMQIEGKKGYFTSMESVHTMNTMVIGAQEKDITKERMNIKEGFCIPKNPLMRKNSFLTGMDPAAGNGRFGLDAMAFYPRVTIWNFERDLAMYHMALINGRIFLPWTNIRTYLGDRPGLILMGRINNLWADSLIVDVGNVYNWNLGHNKWDPPDWRTEYITLAGKTLWDYERDVGENHAHDDLNRRNREKFNLEDMRFQITKRPPAPIEDVEIDEDSPEDIAAAQFDSMPASPGATLDGPPSVSLRGIDMPSVADGLGSMMDVDTLVERLAHEERQQHPQLLGQDTPIKRLLSWTE